MLRTANAQEFAERLKESSTGRMLQDPQIKPLVDRLMGEVSDLYSERAESEVGVGWNDLLKLPKGELAAGIVAVPGAMPAVLVMVEEGDQPTVAKTLLDRARRA